MKQSATSSNDLITSQVNITSHFNDVQVVIYPLRKAQKGLFYVQIYSKEKVPLFGPLQSGMVVHERDLAQLVRQTAMNANRVCRSQPPRDPLEVSIIGMGDMQHGRSDST
ncbi:hypothetical protein Gpo141_00004475 [Globisporangium polare]